jgi:hypothetical protein
MKKPMFQSRFNFSQWLSFKLNRVMAKVKTVTVFIITGALISQLVFIPTASAATYTFTQTSWAGGATGVNAAHPTNEAGWSQYTSQVGVVAGTDVKLPTENYVFTDDGATSTSPTAATRGGGFSNGTNSGTLVTGSGAGASVSLAVASSTSTGGTITTLADGYTIHTFTTTGAQNFVLNNAASVEYLVVAGGGGGGASYGTSGGGGGGGGMRTGTLSLTAGGYSVSVGAGGAGAHSLSFDAGSGGNSIFSSITAAGGGYGGPGVGGGSGGGSGGGGGGGDGGSDFGYAGPAGAGTAGQGNNGGAGSDYSRGGGGGGAGSAGSAPGAFPGVGTGGAGTVSAISGVNVYYAGGGGGGVGSGGGSSTGGVGGGGNGGVISTAGTAGTANTGGGGGGAGSSYEAAGYAGGSGIVIVRYKVYETPGTFTSNVINLGAQAILSTLSYTKTTPTGTAVAVDIRAGNTANPDESWTAWTTNVASAGDISALGLKQYIQYRATLSTSDTTVTPSLDGVTINYSQYATSGSLLSSAYDSGDATNLISKLTWTGSGTSTTGAIKFQVRSSPDGAAWSNWCGPAIACDGTDYFTYDKNGVTLDNDHPLRSGENDRWVQYQVYLTSGGGDNPILSSVIVQYVVNVAPQFEATFGTGGASALQVATSSDPAFGKVKITYSVLDADTSTGSPENRGFVTPTFEYNIGGDWIEIPAQYLSASDSLGKAVGEDTYSNYEATWDAKSQIPNTYKASASVRVKANDNEAANSTKYSGAPSFALDTVSPVVTVGVNGVAGTINITATDNHNVLDYNISNASDLSSATTGNGTTTSLGLSVPWTFSYSTTSATVYSTVRDIYGNTSTTTTVAPAASETMDIRDISNVTTGEFREFVTWSVYPTIPSGATFQKYELWRSNDVGANYSLYTTITDQATNYYIDMSVSSTTTYYYKVRYVDTDGDISPYSAIVFDTPDGFGGTDRTPPTITSVTISDKKNTSAKITWTTDKLAISEVDFGTTLSYGGVATDGSYVMSHTVYVTGLVPNTDYYLRTKSTDIFGNIGTNDNSGAGYLLTTSGGPVISNVTVTEAADNTATIFWNTTTSADSYVDYSVSSNLASYQEKGSATLEGTSTTPVQHKVVLTGLTAATTYYFQVKSTDVDGNLTIDTNNGQYYSFETSLDNKPPVITSVLAPVRASNAAVISWVTDELSTSQVEYGTVALTADGSYATLTQAISTPSIFHVVALSSETTNTAGGTNSLLKKTNYYYRVKSTDRGGNTAVSDEYTFVTNEDGAVVVNVPGGNSGGSGSGGSVDRTPPVVSDVKATKITPFGATISFTTNKETMGTVSYGNSASYGYNTGDLKWSSSHEIALRGLQMGTTYHFNVSAVDQSGNVASSKDQSFKTNMLAEDLGNLKVLETNNSGDIQEEIDNLIESALPSLNPPFISNPEIINVAEDGATILWKTNTKSYGSVSYASDSDYEKDGKYTEEVSLGDKKSVEHEINLKNLRANTKYHFSVKSYVFPQVPGSSPDAVFITSAPKIVAQILDIKTDSFRATWTTDEPTTSIVDYKNVRTGETNRKVIKNLVTNHDVTTENLSPGSVYSVEVSGNTADGNLVEAKEPFTVKMSIDNISPQISILKIDSALVPGRTDRTQTVVSWKTDEPATSMVSYEEGTGSMDKDLANKVEETESYTTTHAVIIPLLKPGTIYRVQITSTDEAGNINKFPMRTIITPRQNESVVDVIFKNFEDTFKVFQKIR